MQKKAITTSKAPSAVGPYSQAVLIGNLLYVSGQIPLIPETGLMIEGGIEEQAHQVFKNLQAVLEEAGMSFENVVKTTVLLDDMNNFNTVNEIYASYMAVDILPARAAYEVSRLPKDAKIEIELVASRE